MKVFVLHECENQGCCDIAGGGEDFFTSEVYGVFSTEKHAKKFRKSNKYLRTAQITETELNPQPLKTKERKTP
jgi:hypothetical protein